MSPLDMMVGYDQQKTPESYADYLDIILSCISLIAHLSFSVYFICSYTSDQRHNIYLIPACRFNCIQIKYYSLFGFRQYV